MSSVIFLVALIVTQLLFILRVLTGPSRTPNSRSVWILTILIFPVGGPIIYLMFGERYMPAKKRELGISSLQRATQASMATAERDGAFIMPEVEPDNSIALFLKQSCGTVPVTGNSAELMTDSNIGMARLAVDIDASVTTVHLSFYIWLADNNGLLIKEALIRAARRGVTCRVLADAIGSRDFIQSHHWKDLESAGVHVARAMHESILAWGLGAGRIDLRDHRKIMVIDNHITFVGSQNCADPEFRVKPKYAPWVDILVRFEGPVARELQALFVSTWLVQTGEDILAILDEALLQSPPVPSTPTIMQDVVLQAMGCGPFDSAHIMSGLFVSTIFAAHRKLCISTPYFVPDDAIMSALTSAARREVEVDLILPRHNDSRIVQAISRSCYPELLQAGVRIHEYEGGLLHAKTMTVDGTLALFGSANMDRRSLELNFENNVVVYCDELTKAIRTRQQTYLDSSVPVDLAAVAKWSLAQRAYQNGLSIFGPMF